ncbi:MAG TPA: hypothetical protein ENN57_01370 [Chloroflexi bacterium]|nr:hypothetical protein [Chloroflexota bacterium]
MALRKSCVIVLVAIIVTMLSGGRPVAVADEPSLEPQVGVLKHGGYNRTYTYYIPSSYDDSQAIPLLFSFHGLGSNATAQIYLTKFTALAERERFIAVFPNSTVLEEEDNPCAANLPELHGSNIQWNVGGNWSLQYCAGVDDVGFIAELIALFKSEYNIDETRIYATGMSNGAMFAYYLALKLPGVFAGIAAVASPMTVNMFEEEVISPLTVIVMKGTGDPVIPYEGSGWISSVDDTINFWIEANQVSTEPVVDAWGPTVADSTRIVRYVYSEGVNEAEVILYKIEDGGHTWPGGPQYADTELIGRVSTHINASALIWKHLPPIQYYLTIHCAVGGLIIEPGKGAFTYDAGTVVDLVAMAGEGYQFVNWTGDVDTIASVNATSTTITMEGDYSIRANFKRVASPVDWALIGGIIAVVVMVGLGVLFVRKKGTA